MPIYEYTCHACGHNSEEMKTIAARDEPCGQPCEKCGASEVKRGIPLPTMGVDATLTAEKATGGGWNELMDRMSAGVPKRYDHLQRAKSNHGGRLGPM